MSKIKLSGRLTFNKSVYQYNGNYSDLEIISGDQSFRCQRLFLSYHSKWFHDYFQKNNEAFYEPDGRKIHVQRVTLPIDPDHSFSEVLKLLYTGECRVNARVIPPFLKIADYYGIPILQSPLRIMYKEPIIARRANENNVIHFAKEFLKFGLIEDAQLLAPTIAVHFQELIVNPYTPKTTLTKERIYEALSPQVLSAVLLDPILHQKVDDRIAIPDNKTACDIIDEYIAFRKDLTLDQVGKESLARCINWKEKQSYELFITNTCDWVPTRISRPLLKIIIQQRNSSIQSFNSDFTSSISTQKIDKISHWYPFVFLDKIAKASSHPGRPKISISGFISTLGGCVNQFNPHVYGFAQVFASVPSLLEDIYDPRFIFETEGEYISNPKGKTVEPMIGFDLGPSARFIPSVCTVNCDCLRRNKFAEKNQPGPKALRYRMALPHKLAVCGTLGGPKEFMGRNFTKQSINCNDQNFLKTLNLAFPKQSNQFRTLAIQLEGDDSKGGRVLSVKELDFEGEFSL